MLIKTYARDHVRVKGHGIRHVDFAVADNVRTHPFRIPEHFKRRFVRTVKAGTKYGVIDMVMKCIGKQRGRHTCKDFIVHKQQVLLSISLLLQNLDKLFGSQCIGPHVNVTPKHGACIRVRINFIKDTDLFTVSARVKNVKIIARSSAKTRIDLVNVYRKFLVHNSAGLPLRLVAEVITDGKLDLELNPGVTTHIGQDFAKVIPEFFPAARNFLGQIADNPLDLIIVKRVDSNNVRPVFLPRINKVRHQRPQTSCKIGLRNKVRNSPAVFLLERFENIAVEAGFKLTADHGVIHKLRRVLSDPVFLTQFGPDSGTFIFNRSLHNRNRARNLEALAITINRETKIIQNVITARGIRRIHAALFKGPENIRSAAKLFFEIGF